MPALPLAGPSNYLRFLTADCERTVNWMPVNIEGQGKGGQTRYLKQCPGLKAFGSAGTGPVTALVQARGILYAAINGRLIRVASDATQIDVGAVDQFSYFTAVNNTQIAIASKTAMRVYDLDDLSMSSVELNFLGTSSLDVLDGYGILAQPGTTTFYITANQDFTVIDALQYASAEGSNGNITSLIVKNREIQILKEQNSEIWYDSGATDFPLTRNDGANIEAGSGAGRTLVKIGGVAYWLGKDASGGNVVFAMSGYAPQRVSNRALEEQLSEIDDVSDSYAFSYTDEGQSFIVLQVPGLQTTWVYDVSASMWHERAEYVNGVFQPWRATCHAYCYGKHFVGDASGQIYVMEHAWNMYGTDVMVRDRYTPTQASPTNQPQRFGMLQIECSVGEGVVDVSIVPSDPPYEVQTPRAAKLMLRYANDGTNIEGKSWKYLSLGKIGELKTRCRATMLGSARTRRWQIRVTDDIRCDVLDAIVNEV